MIFVIVKIIYDECVDFCSLEFIVIIVVIDLWKKKFINDLVNVLYELRCLKLLFNLLVRILFLCL